MELKLAVTPTQLLHGLGFQSLFPTLVTHTLPTKSSRPPQLLTLLTEGKATLDKNQGVMVSLPVCRLSSGDH